MSDTFKAIQTYSKRRYFTVGQVLYKAKVADRVLLGEVIWLWFIRGPSDVLCCCSNEIHHIVVDLRVSFSSTLLSSKISWQLCFLKSGAAETFSFTVLNRQNERFMIIRSLVYNYLKIRIVV